jgi:hypothetical protein
MGAQGTVTVDFGTGKLDTNAPVTGQGAITTANLVEAWLSGNSTSNNLTDAGFAEDFLVFAGDIINGTGFTVYVQSQFGRGFGQYVVNWVWN